MVQRWILVPRQIGTDPIPASLGLGNIALYAGLYTLGDFEMVAFNDPSGDLTADLIKRYIMYTSNISIVSTCFGITNSMFCS